MKCNRCNSDLGSRVDIDVTMAYERRWRLHVSGDLTPQMRQIIEDADKDHSSAVFASYHLYKVRHNVYTESMDGVIHAWTDLIVHRFGIIEKIIEALEHTDIKLVLNIELNLKTNITEIIESPYFPMKDGSCPSFRHLVLEFMRPRTEATTLTKKENNFAGKLLAKVPEPKKRDRHGRFLKGKKK